MMRLGANLGVLARKLHYVTFWGYYTNYYTVIKNTRKSLIYMGF
jgi:hypothetical protein